MEAKYSKAFPVAGKRARGYSRTQVDDFFERARQAYEGVAADSDVLRAVDFRTASFAIERGGYATRFVDAAIDRLEDVFFEREKRDALRTDDYTAWQSEMRQLAAEIAGRIGRKRGKRFRRRGVFARGYRRSQVDAFLERVGQGLAGDADLTVSQLRESMFHAQWRGYDEAQVDAFIDAVIDLKLAER